MPEIIDEEDNIYRICRNRAHQASNDDSFRSREKAHKTFNAQGYSISAASLKDYESGKTIPNPDIVKKMAEVYGTPELKWMHCAKACPIGKAISKSDRPIGTSDIYDTYFELTGSFKKVSDIQQQLQEIISDKKVSDDEKPLMKEIMHVMKRITESTRDLQVWCEREGIDLEED